MLRKHHNHPILKPIVRFVKFRILHVDDSPHRLALGVGLGLFVAWTPTIGLQMLIVLFLSFLLRANKFLSLSFVWVSNIFTLIPIYLPAYILGRHILRAFNLVHSSNKEQVIEMLRRLGSFSLLFDIWTYDFWKSFFEVLLKIGLPLWIGGAVMGLIIGGAGYFMTYRIILWYRNKYPHRRFHTKIHLFRKKTQNQ